MNIKNNRPRINIKLDQIDWIVEGLGILCLMYLLGITFVHYNALPDSIPTHYGLDGQADRYGGKATILILPIIGVLMYVGLTIMNRYPHTFNYSVPITRDNAERQYRISTKMIRWIKAIIVALFAYILHTTIGAAKGQSDDLGPFFTPILLVLIFGVIGYALYLSTRNK